MQASRRGRGGFRRNRVDRVGIRSRVDLSSCNEGPAASASHQVTFSQTSWRSHPMSSLPGLLPAVRIDLALDRIGTWWAGANAGDFGMMAVCIVVGVWFLTKYYSD